MAGKHSFIYNKRGESKCLHERDQLRYLETFEWFDNVSFELNAYQKKLIEVRETNSEIKKAKKSKKEK